MNTHQLNILKTLRFTWIALMISQGLFLILSAYPELTADASQPLNTPKDLESMANILYIVAAVCAIGVFAVPKLMLKTSPVNTLKLVGSSGLVSFAFCQAIASYGLILSIAHKDGAEGLPFFFLSTVLMIIKFPQKSLVENVTVR